MADSEIKYEARVGRQASKEEIARQLRMAKSGDQAEFERLTEPHRSELLSHCYRMLGSILDAEDLVQETFLRAWRRLETFQGRASFRAWLYKIATNGCIDFLDRRSRRTLPQHSGALPNRIQDDPQPLTDPIWLEPFPDELLAPAEHSPEARYEALESITLAFQIALQSLPPRQRAVLILRDVLNWRSKEVARTLESTVSGVNSMLYRARATMAERSSEEFGEKKGEISEEMTTSTLDRYVRMWEQADVDGLTALLTEQATFPMPPFPMWFVGRAAIGRFLSTSLFDGQAAGRWRLKPVAASGKHGFACYRLAQRGGNYHAFAIQVLTFEGNRIADVTTFGNPKLFSPFGLPLKLSG